MTRTRFLTLIVPTLLLVPILPVPMARAEEPGAGIERLVGARLALEEVQARHRISSESSEFSGAVESLEAEIAAARVRDDLRKLEALRERWDREISPSEIQAELERMARSSRDPERLGELFAALDEDPRLAAEALARPVLADRILRSRYARDGRLHGELLRRARTELALSPTLKSRERLSGRHTELELLRPGERPLLPRREEDVTVLLLEEAVWLERLEGLPAPGTYGELEERDGRFLAEALLERDGDSLHVARVSWLKTGFDEWWSRESASYPGAAPPDGTESYFLPEIASEATAETVSETWSDTAPGPQGRFAHSAAWTGSEMIVWGGHFEDLDLDSGSRYDPATDSWAALPTLGAPSPRSDHSAVWAGGEMIVWGGRDGSSPVLADGGRYSPSTDAWEAVATLGAPTARCDHTAVWTGSEMIVWGGAEAGWGVFTDSGGRYDPSTNTWTTMNMTGAPAARHEHTAVWTDSEMIIWGGWDGSTPWLGDGGRYNPAEDTWTATAAAGAPSPRWHHSAVWTGGAMIVWGGEGESGYLAGGALYTPGDDGWQALPGTGAPSPREKHTAVLAEDEMIVWGGWDDQAPWLDTGGRYELSSGLWAPTSTEGAPEGRFDHTAVWTGSVMIVWGGGGLDYGLATGGAYSFGPLAAVGNLRLAEEVDGTHLSWDATPEALGYDVVRGLLSLLLAGLGDFGSATETCLADDAPGTTLVDPDVPAVEDGYWYLVRPVLASGPGTYNSEGPAQIADRDPSLATSPDACP